MAHPRRALEQEMLQKYPNLYSDMYGDPRYTLMAFGIEVGQGWFQIIRDLSAKLEPIITKMKEEEEVLPNPYCDGCGRRRRWHFFFFLVNVIKYFFLNKWKAIKLLPSTIKRSKRWGRSTWRSIRWMLLRYKRYKPCRHFRYQYPRVCQVKEKFGTLRFYMTSYFEEIEELISKAEGQSSKTCEGCGQPGKLRTGRPWILTLCEACHEKEAR